MYLVNFLYARIIFVKNWEGYAKWQGCFTVRDEGMNSTPHIKFLILRQRDDRGVFLRAIYLSRVEVLSPDLNKT